VWRTAAGRQTEETDHHEQMPHQATLGAVEACVKGPERPDSNAAYWLLLALSTNSVMPPGLARAPRLEHGPNLEQVPRTSAGSIAYDRLCQRVAVSNTGAATFQPALQRLDRRIHDGLTSAEASAQRGSGHR
jgi:hypothetical protein